MKFERYDKQRVGVVEFWYPRIEEKIDTLEVELIDVRASTGLRIRYDFNRDGWAIEQPVGHDGEWREAAFIESFEFVSDEGAG